MWISKKISDGTDAACLKGQHTLRIVALEQKSLNELSVLAAPSASFPFPPEPTPVGIYSL